MKGQTYMRSIINNAKLAAVNGGMTVYEFQDSIRQPRERISFNHMSNDEINDHRLRERFRPKIYWQIPEGLMVEYTRILP